MLMKEGLSKGLSPALQVLEISSGSKRSGSDILPYLGALSHLFSPLPQSPGQMRLKAALISLSDVECVTKTMIKIPQSLKILGDRKGSVNSSVSG